MGDPINYSSSEHTADETTERSLPILPVRDTVLFPHAVLPLTVGRESSVQLINSLGEDKTIVVVAQREARVDSPQPTDLYAVGSLAVVHKVVRMPNQSLFVFAEGLERVKVTEYTQLTPFMYSTVETIPEIPAPKSSAIEALQRNVLTGRQPGRESDRLRVPIHAHAGQAAAVPSGIVIPFPRVLLLQTNELRSEEHT